MHAGSGKPLARSSTHARQIGVGDRGRASDVNTDPKIGDRDTDEDLYFVDTRNAEPRVLGRTTVVRSPTTHTPVTTSRVTYAPPPQATIYPAQYGTQFSPLAGWGPSPMYAQAPIYAQPPWMGQLGGLFGGLGLGDIIKLGA